MHNEQSIRDTFRETALSWIKNCEPFSRKPLPHKTPSDVMPVLGSAFKEIKKEIEEEGVSFASKEAKKRFLINTLSNFIVFGSFCYAFGVEDKLSLKGKE